MNVVEFKADQSDQEAVIEILEATLEKARAGRLKDVAIVTAEADPEEGPMHVYAYYGQGAFATLVAGVAALAFDLQYDRHKDAEGR
jgi:hypothetical protein